MTTETLSDKIKKDEYHNIPIIQVSDVKEFIKKLKEGIRGNLEMWKNMKTNIAGMQIFYLINDLAGKELSNG